MYKISKKLISNNEQNERKNIDKVLEYLENGQNVGIVSDQGCPIISDPGYVVVREVSNRGFNVVALPGANALLPALMASGIAPLPFSFYGFLNAKQSKRIKELENLKYVAHTIIFYEAPHRIMETLADMLEVFGNRNIVIARELTKTFEEYIRGTIEEILELDSIKGEIVLIVEGYKEEIKLDDNPFVKIEELISLGYKPNEAIKEISKLYNLDRKELYKSYLDYKNQGE